MDRARSPTPGEREIGGGKRNRCSSVARNDALSASVARGSAQKPIPERRSDRHFYRGEGGGNISKAWTISTNQVRVIINTRGEMETNYYGR